MKIGVFIERGPMDWQIVQQVNGNADFRLSGSWISNECGFETVRVRVVREDTGMTVIPWKTCKEMNENRWETWVQSVPAGGLYRIETCLTTADDLTIEWGIRGDMVHHVGVGDVYVIAGQSNSAGYGKDIIYDPPEIGVHLFKNSGRWDLASHPMNESTGTVHEENLERANPGHSPYLSFAKQLKRELGYPIGLLQAALGGSPLSAWNPREDGVLYKNMVNVIRKQGGKVKGILWYQGCSDASEDLCNSYFDRFDTMVSCLREKLGDRELPILTVQLNRFVVPSTEASDRCWGIIREAQRQAAQRISEVFIIPSIDCTLSDMIHNSASSNLVLGERLAGIALRELYGRNFGFHAPDLVDAKKVDKNKVSLRFRNVYDKLYTYGVGADALPFSAEDESGFLKITSYELEGKDTLVLTLDRDLNGECQVHGAFEQNPKTGMPVDFVSHLPILSFYGVRVLE